MTGNLYLCATPIGNLEDMTFRVMRTLKEVDLIAAEDTRNSIKLLNHFDIHTPMTSYHEYNQIEKAHVSGGKTAGRAEYCPDHGCGNTGNLRSGRGAGADVPGRGCACDFSAGSLCLCYGADAVGTAYQTFLL